ncbi:MAG: hypothetical protein FWC47_06890 [Oscillospiraceae bacterium]|nr:hypothetical protein [Oscillospiraceae bacterium]
MKKGVFISTLLSLSILYIVFSCSTAFANDVFTQNSQEGSIVKPPTGGNVEYSYLSFNVTDKTNGEYIDDIKVVLKDIAAGNTYEIVLGKDIDYTNITSVLANTTYKITLEYPHSNEFIVCNSDGTVIDKFGATVDGYVFDWIVKSISDTQANTTAKITEVSNSKADDSTVKDGETLFKEFCGLMEKTESDTHWSNFYSVYDVYKYTESKQYATVCKGDTSDWLKLSDFDKSIWYETYIRLCNCIELSDYDYFFGSDGNFLNNTINNTYHNLTLFGDGSQAEAYKSLMLWQYNYFLINAKFYDFVTNLNYIQINKDSTSKKVISQNQEQVNVTDSQTQSQTQIQEGIKETVKDIFTGNPIQSNPDKNIWGKTGEVIKSNITTIIIFIVLSSILGGVMLYRKRKTIEDEDE